MRHVFPVPHMMHPRYTFQYIEHLLFTLSDHKYWVIIKKMTKDACVPGAKFKKLKINIITM